MTEFASPGDSTRECDLLIMNAHILSMDRERRVFPHGAVAISGNTIVVSGSDADLGGAAYIFVEPEGGWADMTQTAELTFSTEQTAGSVFGVAIDGDVVAVGMATESIGGNTYQGAAYVYVKPSSGWTNMTQTAQLVATDGRAYQLLGASVSVSGRNVVAGAPETTVGGVLKAGLAYLFVEPADGWSGTLGETTEFEASDGTPEAYFGTSVSVSGNVAAVGAPNGVVNSYSPRGIAYIFEKPAAGRNSYEHRRVTMFGDADGRLML